MQSSQWPACARLQWLASGRWHLCHARMEYGIRHMGRSPAPLGFGCMAMMLSRRVVGQVSSCWQTLRRSTKRCVAWSGSLLKNWGPCWSTPLPVLLDCECMAWSNLWSVMGGSGSVRAALTNVVRKFVSCAPRRASRCQRLPHVVALWSAISKGVVACVRTSTSVRRPSVCGCFIHLYRWRLCLSVSNTHRVNDSLLVV